MPVADLDDTFAALSDRSRRAILAALQDGEKRVTEIAQPFPMSLNAVSKHLKMLERAGLVRREVRGRDHYIALAAEPLGVAAGWIDQYRAFWEPRLDALAAFLDEQSTTKNKEDS
jgi:DNA-binding transcriptional ArsR family regulator